MTDNDIIRENQFYNDNQFRSRQLQKKYSFKITLLLFLLAEEGNHKHKNIIK